MKKLVIAKLYNTHASRMPFKKVMDQNHEQDSQSKRRTARETSSLTYHAQKLKPSHEMETSLMRYEQVYQWLHLTYFRKKMKDAPLDHRSSTVLRQRYLIALTTVPHCSTCANFIPLKKRPARSKIRLHPHAIAELYDPEASRMLFKNATKRIRAL